MIIIEQFNDQMFNEVFTKTKSTTGVTMCRASVNGYRINFNYQNSTNPKILGIQIIKGLSRYEKVFEYNEDDEFNDYKELAMKLYNLAKYECDIEKVAKKLDFKKAKF